MRMCPEGQTHLLKWSEGMSTRQPEARSPSAGPPGISLPALRVDSASQGSQDPQESMRSREKNET